MPASRFLWRPLSVARTQMATFSLCPLMAFPPPAHTYGVSLCPNSLFLKGHRSDWTGALPKGHFPLITSLFKGPASRYSPTLRSLGLGLQHRDFGRAHLTPSWRGHLETVFVVLRNCQTVFFLVILFTPFTDSATCVCLCSI